MFDERKTFDLGELNISNQEKLKELQDFLKEKGFEVLQDFQVLYENYEDLRNLIISFLVSYLNELEK